MSNSWDIRRIIPSGFRSHTWDIHQLATQVRWSVDDDVPGKLRSLAEHEHLREQPLPRAILLGRAPKDAIEARRLDLIVDLGFPSLAPVATARSAVLLSGFRLAVYDVFAVPNLPSQVRDDRTPRGPQFGGGEGTPRYTDPELGADEGTSNYPTAVFSSTSRARIPVGERAAYGTEADSPLLDVDAFADALTSAWRVLPAHERLTVHARAYEDLAAVSLGLQRLVRDDPPPTQRFESPSLDENAWLEVLEKRDQLEWLMVGLRAFGEADCLDRALAAVDLDAERVLDAAAPPRVRDSRWAQWLRQNWQGAWWAERERKRWAAREGAD